MQKTSFGVFELLDSFVILTRRTSIAIDRHAAQCGVRATSYMTNLIRRGQKLKLLTQHRLQNRKAYRRACDTNVGKPT